MVAVAILVVVDKKNVFVAVASVAPVAAVAPVAPVAAVVAVAVADFDVAEVVVNEFVEAVGDVVVAAAAPVAD